MGPELMDEFFVLAVFAIDEFVLEGRPLLEYCVSISSLRGIPES